jgi:hypothetical protein
MSRVFISSVIGGFEPFRQAAKQAVELLGYQPIMSEQFGARAYSSEIACIHEVEQSDVYIVILGERYGSTTSDGISITHSEYRAARASNRSILAFIQQTDMEPEQLAFKTEIEDYQEGVFRSGFSTTEELKDEIVKALRQHEVMHQAAPQNEFDSRVNGVVSNFQSDWDSKPELIMACWPQPTQAIDIVGLESKLDNIFSQMCDLNITNLRDGYEMVTGDEWTGLKSGKISYVCFDDGLTLLIADPIEETDSIFSGSFVSPKLLSLYSSGFLSVCNATSGYLRIELVNMDNAYVSEPPTGSSFSMRMIGKDNLGFSRLFTPLTQSAYFPWVEQCLKRFERTFAYKTS